MLACKRKPNDGTAKDVFHEISICRQFNLGTKDLERFFIFLRCCVLTIISHSYAPLVTCSLRLLFTSPSQMSFSSSRWRGWAHCKTRLMDRMNREIVFAVVTFREQKLFWNLYDSVSLIYDQDFISWSKLNQAQQVVLGFWDVPSWREALIYYSHFLFI